MNAVGPPQDKSKKHKIGETVGAAAVAALPVAGGPLAVVWQQTVGAAYEKRRRAWEEELVGAVNDLTSRVEDLDVEDLADNAQFLVGRPHLA